MPQLAQSAISSANLVMKQRPSVPSSFKTRYGGGRQVCRGSPEDISYCSSSAHEWQQIAKGVIAKQPIPFCLKCLVNFSGHVALASRLVLTGASEPPAPRSSFPPHFSQAQPNPVNASFRSSLTPLDLHAPQRRCGAALKNPLKNRPQKWTN